MANWVISRREVLTKQPSAAELDWSNPLVRLLAPGAKLIAAQNTGWLNLASNGVSSSPTVFGTVNTGVKPHIYGQKTPGGGKNGRGYAGDKSGLTSFTIAAVVVFDGISGTQVIVGNDDANEGGVRLQHTAGTLQITKSGVGNVVLGPSVEVNTTYSIVVSRHHFSQTIFYAVCDLSTGKVQKGSVSDTSGFLLPTSGIWPIGYGRDSVESVNGIVCQALVSGSPLYLPDVEKLAANPWQIFAPRETRLFVPVGGGGSVNANASGALSAVAVTAPSASASGSASATGACAAITITAPTATASAGGSASASGSFSALSISPATATATATKSATASGSFATISLSAPTGTATGTSAGNAIATGTPAQITISQAAAIAIGSAVASGGFQSIGITAPSATASVGNGNATASGSWAAVSITAPTGYASSGFVRAPSGIGPTVIQPGSIRPRQSATSRPSNTGGRRY